MRENRTYGSEGGAELIIRSLPLSIFGATIDLLLWQHVRTFIGSGSRQDFRPRFVLCAEALDELRYDFWGDYWPAALATCPDVHW